MLPTASVVALATTQLRFQWIVGPVPEPACDIANIFAVSNALLVDFDY